ncbi:MAG: hypothetical protein R3330_10600, partial [Saprospiraceae bacterium]|nr:hypothetical protein [Saprospiraceae bacterium]
MRIKTSFTLLLGLAVVAISLTGCLRDNCDRTHTFIQFDPVYKPLEEMRTGIAVTDARELENPGNINYYNGFLLVNERREGIHIIDNSDPANPVNLAFIEIPGNLDMAVKDGILYADMYLDLVAIDISDPLNASLLSRREDVFSTFYPFQDNLGYVVEFIETEVTVEVDCNDQQFGSPWFWRGGLFFANIDVAFDNSAGSSGELGGVGIGGSMARFTIAKDHLYTLDDWKMRVFDISQPDPVPGATIDVGWGIETLFPYGEYLFIGSNSGMFIYDNANPAQPVFLSSFQHARACDPVFVSEDVAYVTLRDGTICEGFVNQLDVIDVSDMANPSLIRSYGMQHPHGLSVVDETLYLCEGQHGLKVFSVEDLQRIDDRLLDHVRNVHAFDVIVLPPGDLVMMVGQDGIYQYDASDREDLVELSVI